MGEGIPVAVPTPAFPVFLTDSPARGLLLRHEHVVLQNELFLVSSVPEGVAELDLLSLHHLLQLQLGEGHEVGGGVEGIEKHLIVTVQHVGRLVSCALFIVPQTISFRKERSSLIIHIQHRFVGQNRNISIQLCQCISQYLRGPSDNLQGLSL